MPFAVYYWTVAIIALAGMADAIYLAVAHYRVYTDMGYQSFCAISKSINCDTVSQSPYSIFVDVPVPVWGIVGYALFLALLPAARRGASNLARVWPTLFILALCFSAYSIILAIISIRYIHSYCIMCLASYAVNFTLLFYAWLIHKRFGKTSITAGIKSDFQWMVQKQKKKAGILFCVSIGVVLSLILFVPHYWEISVALQEGNLAEGITEDGHPWIGAKKAKLVIVEFTDYQCFQCKKMHFFLRKFIASHPGKIKLVHRNFPMDHAYNPLVKEPYHVGSGKMALFSLYAVQNNKFWEFNDMLFNIDAGAGHFNLREMAKKVGFDVHELAGSVNDLALKHKLRKDIHAGLKLGITGTPGYLINGKVYVGHVPPEILDLIMH